MDECLDDLSRRNALKAGGALLLASLAPATLRAAGASQPSDLTGSKATSTALTDTITTKDGVKIFFKDWGSGQPLVFSHGWPLSADDWDSQMLFFLNHGFRVIAHDRRGHGRSTQTAAGHRRLTTMASSRSRRLTSTPI